MAQPIRVACTALTKRIKAGRVDRQGIAFVGKPTDVTSDCLRAVVEFVGTNATAVVHAGGKPAFEITVKAVAPQES